VDDDIHTEGNGTDDRDDYNDHDFDDTIIVDDEVASALSLAPDGHMGKIMMKNDLFFGFYSFNLRPVRFIVIIYNHQC